MSDFEMNVRAPVGGVTRGGTVDGIALNADVFVGNIAGGQSHHWYVSPGMLMIE